MSSVWATLSYIINVIFVLQIKPKQDPWQQKLLTKLKQWKKVDLLMDLQSKFLEASELETLNVLYFVHSVTIFSNIGKPRERLFSASSKLSQPYVPDYKLQAWDTEAEPLVLRWCCFFLLSSLTSGKLDRKDSEHRKYEFTILTYSLGRS